MIKGIEAVLVFSENPQSLTEFYRDKVGLKTTTEMEVGEEGEKAFSFEEVGGCNLYILPHSKVKGKNTNPERIILNFEVDDIKKEVEKLEQKGIKKIADIYHVEDYGQIATFEDIDGNYFQLVQTRELN